VFLIFVFFVFSSRRRHTRCALVTGVQTCALPISYPRQNELALALREVGRIERTLFMIYWILDAGLQRQAQIGLNKGEAHHALKRAISFHRRGEIRDRSGEGQHYRIPGMTLLAAIIAAWNTMKLGDVVNTRAASETHNATQ